MEIARKIILQRIKELENEIKKLKSNPTITWEDYWYQYQHLAGQICGLSFSLGAIGER